ncbi:hypothetical protein ACJX0J_037920, partial [Zea mays]
VLSHKENSCSLCGPDIFASYLAAWSNMPVNIFFFTEQYQDATAEDEEYDIPCIATMVPDKLPRAIGL